MFIIQKIQIQNDIKQSSNLNPIGKQKNIFHNSLIKNNIDLKIFKKTTRIRDDYKLSLQQNIQQSIPQIRNDHQYQENNFCNSEREQSLTKMVGPMSPFFISQKNKKRKSIECKQGQLVKRHVYERMNKEQNNRNYKFYKTKIVKKQYASNKNQKNYQILKDFNYNNKTILPISSVYNQMVDKCTKQFQKYQKQVQNNKLNILTSKVYNKINNKDLIQKEIYKKKFSNPYTEGSDKNFLNIEGINPCQKTNIRSFKKLQKNQKEIEIEKNEFQNYFEDKQDSKKYKKSFDSKLRIKNSSMHFIHVQFYQREQINKLKIYCYRDFLWKIAFSYGLYVLPLNQDSKNFKVFIGPGNNCLLIKSLFKRRWWWNIVNTWQQDVNFSWSQMKIKQIFQIQPNNIRTFDFPLQNTQGRYGKNRAQAKLKKYNKRIMNQHQYIIWFNYITLNWNYQAKINCKLKGRKELNNKNRQITNSRNLIMHNHLKQNNYIGNKKALFYTMRQYYRLNNQQVFKHLPLTFHIKQGIQDSEFFQFVKIFHKKKKIIRKLQEKGITNQVNMWIVKPGQLTNRGNGISVCNNLEQIKKIIKVSSKHSNGKKKTFIIQQYLHRPFLYNRRKFDIRHFIMIACINGCIKGYWYEEGYIRTSSYQYSLKSTDTYIHLTNNSVQKNCEDYGKYQKGNKILYSEFQKFLDQKQKHKNFYQQVYPKMKKLATDLIKASFLDLDPQRKENNFQLFGMDFIIDQEFKPWLIQVNTNPCLQTSNPLQAKLIPQLIQNVLKIGLDPLFPPPYKWPAQKLNIVAQNILEANRFQLIFDQMINGSHLRKLFNNSENIIEKIGEIEDENQFFQDNGKQIEIE